MQPALILTDMEHMIYEHGKRAHATRPDLAFSALPGGGVDIVDQQFGSQAKIAAGFVLG